MINCEIKVLYVGENRNHSYISKEVAEDMAKTLRGVPIVGYYRKDKEDFGDHGKQVIIDGDGIKFNTLTIPYGFVAPDAKVWFQKFEDTNEKTNEVTIHEYLMTNGYLWKKQFEGDLSIDGGKGQSMELDEDTLDGNWTKKVNHDYELFIINDAIFSKLCILGNDVEPCFEGASIEEIPSEYSKMDNNFKNTLFSMIEDLKKIEGRDQQMENKEDIVDTQEQEAKIEGEEQKEDVPTVETTPAEEGGMTEPEPEKTLDNSDESNLEQNQETVEEPGISVEDFNKLQNEYNLLKESNEELQNKYNELLNFKLQIENEKKDELINSFYMLSDEDKKDVIEHKTDYSYDQIEAKLSVICVRKKVSFKEEDKDNNPAPATYNLNSEEEAVPAYIAELKKIRDSKE